ncbi:hypothetical protein MTO96_000074 [Rhipicephalus appendiculatus]
MSYGTYGRTPFGTTPSYGTRAGYGATPSYGTTMPNFASTMPSFAASTMDDSGDDDDDSSGSSAAPLQPPPSTGISGKVLVLAGVLALIVSFATTLLIGLVFHHRGSAAAKASNTTHVSQKTGHLRTRRNALNLLSSDYCLN